MDISKKEFIKLARTCNVLTFGEFTLKSGRISPYFFNAGLFYTSHALHKLGRYYARALIEQHHNVDHLFGPAYKGLPLATATAIAFSEYGKDVTVTFNRKEAKDHGEKGNLIGSPLQGNTVIIDDVITAGTAFREAQQLIKNSGGKLTAVVIALDRCEQGLKRQSTLQDIKNEGIEVYSIITLFDLIEYLKGEGEDEHVKKLIDYHQKYGA